MDKIEESLIGLEVEKLASFLNERQISKIRLNGIEAKELVLNYLGLRGTPFYQKLRDEIKSVLSQDSNWNEVLTYAKDAKQLKKISDSPSTDFTDFNIYINHGYTKGQIGEIYPKFIFPVSMEVDFILEKKREVLGQSTEVILSSKEATKRIGSVLEVLTVVFGLSFVISKIAENLNISYNNAISVGQAKAVVRRIIGRNLSSTERSHLFEFRKKIHKYKRLINDFDEIVQIKKRSPLMIDGLREELDDKLSNHKNSHNYEF
ncbi:MAG: hypothetical protein ACXADY_06710 [Candidatus Hodarchaeales archaeon]